MDSSSGSSPDNPKKLSNSEKNNLDSTFEISENSAIDEKKSKISEMNQEKRKMTPQDSTEKSPNDFQSPRLKPNSMEQKKTTQLIEFQKIRLNRQNRIQTKILWISPTKPISCWGLI